MTPATFPGLPVTLFPGLLLPGPLAGVSVVDLTAAVAAIAWAIGALVALRIAIALSRDTDRPRHSADRAAPSKPSTPNGFRDAA